MKKLLATLCVATLVACTTPPRPAAVAVPPPLPAQAVTDTHFGVQVADPYRHLENVSDPQVQAWMRAQADAANAALSQLPGRAALLARIQAVEGAAGGVTTTVIRTDSGRLFFMRRNPGENQFKLVWRDGPDGTDHVVFDPEAGVAAGAQPRAVMDFTPSKDGSKLAYAVQAGGGEIGTLHVIDVATGRELTPPADRIRYAGASWLEDGSGFFYGRLREGYDKLPPGERFGDRTTHFRSLVDGRDRAVFSASRNPELQLPTFAGAAILQIPGTQTAAAIVFAGVDRNLQLLVADLAAARQGGPVWKRVVSSADEVTGIDIGHGHFYLKSARNTPRYRLLRMPVADPLLARAQELVPQGDGALGEVGVARDGNVPEFGTIKKEDEFKALLAMSSYHHIKDGVRYPAVMAVHGINDIRVDVWQSAKFTSRLQQANPSGKPVLLRLEYDSGHGQGSSRAQLQQRMADVFAFMLWQFGDQGVGPK